MKLLLNPDARKRPTAMFALGHKWLENIVVPVRTSCGSITQLPNANKNLVFSKPGGKGSRMSLSNSSTQDSQSAPPDFLGEADESEEEPIKISGNGFEELLLRLRKSEDDE